MGRIAGAVLAGGESRRMGRTKALVPVDGVPMAARVAAALEAGGCEEVVVVGGSVAELQMLGRPIVADVHPGAGPVGGVITALLHFDEAAHVLVAACDLAMLDAPTVEHLLLASRRHPECAAIVAHTDRVEPALVVWNRAATGDVVELFADGERAVHRVLARIDTHEVQVDAAALLNVNRPEDVLGSDQRCQ